MDADVGKHMGPAVLRPEGDEAQAQDLRAEGRVGLYLVGSAGCQAHSNTLVSWASSYALLEINAGWEDGRQLFAAHNVLSNNVLYDPALPRQVTVSMARGAGHTNNHLDHNCYFATNGPLLFSINDYLDNSF